MKPDFRTETIGWPTKGSGNFWEQPTTVETPGGGSGIPWPGRRNPTYPGTSGSPYVEPYEPQGPPAPEETGGPPAEVAGLFKSLTARDWVALATALTGVVGNAVTNRPTTTPTTATTDPQLKELLALMQNRIKKSEPLYDSALAMANGLLPTQYQRANPLLGGQTGAMTPPMTNGTMPPDETPAP